MPKLRTVNLKYKKIATPPTVLGDVYRPIIPITVTRFNEDKDEISEKIMVLIDSGADFCMFSGEFGELLNIAVKKGVPFDFFGVGGSVIKGYVHRIGLSVDSMPVINVDAVFSYGLNDQSLGIVGQKCFFDHYSINFRYRQGEIIIKNG